MQVGRLVAIVLVGLLAAGCGGGDDDSSPDTSRRAPDSSSSTAPPTTRSAESEVEEAYLAYSEMFMRLLGTPNPDDPEITQRAVGEAATSLTDNLTTLESLGRAVRFGESYRYRLLSVDISAERAVARECVVDDATVIEVATDEPVAPSPIATVLNRITLQFDRGAWRVSAIEQEDGWEGVGGCAN
jgi:hypothetical protein